MLMVMSNYALRLWDRLGQGNWKKMHLTAWPAVSCYDVLTGCHDRHGL